jgi:hypothetical protein
MKKVIKQITIILKKNTKYNRSRVAYTFGLIIYSAFSQSSDYSFSYPDRRPIDPPPIIQIRLNNASPQQTEYVLHILI